MKAYFNVKNSDVFNILVWNFISHILSSVYLLYVRAEDLKVIYFVTTRGHWERWLYFYANIILYENQAETLKCSIHNLFPEYLRLQPDMLVIIHLYYPCVCLAISRGNVVVSLYSVSLTSVLMKHVLSIYYLYLTYLYN